VKEVSEDGSFTGILSVYDVVDDGNDLVEAGAFTKTLKESGGQVPCLYRHEDPIGTLEVIDTGKALEVKGQLVLDLNPDGSPAVPEAFKALALMRKKVMKGLSIGFITVKSSVVDGIRRLKELVLKEGSVVVFPMLRLAQITGVKENGMERKMTFEEALDQIETWRARYAYMEALDQSIGSLMYDESIATEDCVQQIAAACEQFMQSMTDLCPKLRALLNESSYYDFKKLFEIEKKAGRRLSAASRSKIDDAMKQLQALLDDEAAESDDKGNLPAERKGTSSPAAAPPSSEPDLHSMLSSKLTDLKGVLQWN
jgi:HK97 family phage prohead protease